MPELILDCASCYQPLGAGRIVHDIGAPWHHECRRLRIAADAATNADRHIRRDPVKAAVLAAIQRAAA